MWIRNGGRREKERGSCVPLFCKFQGEEEMGSRMQPYVFLKETKDIISRSCYTLQHLTVFCLSGLMPYPLVNFKFSFYFPMVGWLCLGDKRKEKRKEVKTFIREN